jgi:hypothetical protein
MILTILHIKFKCLCKGPGVLSSSYHFFIVFRLVLGLISEHSIYEGTYSIEVSWMVKHSIFFSRVPLLTVFVDWALYVVTMLISQ